MILPPPAREDFDFQGDIHVDVENKGFSRSEMQTLAGAPPGSQAGAKGVDDWWKSVGDWTARQK